LDSATVIFLQGKVVSLESNPPPPQPAGLEQAVTKKKIKIEKRYVHIMPANTDAELLPAYMSKATNKIVGNKCT
jgi:hypothetical protein